MSNFFSDVYGQFGSVWGKLSAGQKIIICLVGLTLGAGIVGVVYWTGQIEMGLLYGGLSPEQAGEIDAKLTEQGVPHVMEAGGAIRVPHDRVYELRAQLAMGGLSIGDGKGLELFDSVQLHMTDFMQKVNLTRALQTEIERALSSLNQVAAAKVLIVRPKQTIFSEMANPATASVAIKLVPGYALSRREVAGITNLVASSVEGLMPENVKIIDQNSRLLTLPIDDDDSQVAGTQLELKQNWEKNQVKKIQDLMDEVVGVNKVRVACDVVLKTDFSDSKLEEWQQPSGGKLIKSEKTISEETTNTTPNPGGAAGVAANLEENTSSADPVSKTSKEDIDREFAVNKILTDQMKRELVVERISLSIFVDESIDVTQQQDIEVMVQNAVGYVDTRDSCKIMALKFTESAPVEEAADLESIEQKEFIFTLTEYGIKGLSVAAVILILFMMMKRAEKKIKTSAGERTEGVEKMEEDRREKTRKRVKEDVISTVKTDPRMASEILHEWLEKEEAAR